MPEFSGPLGSVNVDLDYRAMYQRNPHLPDKIAPCIQDLSLRLSPDDSLLDAGCCEGHLYDWLGHKKYTGIDIVPENISAAKARHPEVRYEVGNILELTEVWDVVWCSRVLMHLPNFEENVEKLRRIARKKLYVLIPMRGSYTSIETNKLGVKGTVMFRSFSSQELEASNPAKVITHEKFSTVIYNGNVPTPSD